LCGRFSRKCNGAGVVEIVAETDGAQGAGEGGEQVGGGGFVVPDVGATAVAAAGVVVGAFEAVELAIGGAEADGRDQGGEVGAGGVLDGGGDGGFAEGGGEAAGLLFQGVEVRGGVFGGGPGVGEAGGVVVADEGVFVALGSVPAAAARRAIGEMPGEQEGEIGVRAGGDGAVEAERADGPLGGLGAEFAIGGEIVPEEHGGVPPAVALPAAQVGDVGAGGVERGEREAALERIGGGEVGAGHEEAGERGGGAVFVDARVGGRRTAGGVLDGPGDGDLGGRRARVGDAIAQDGDGEAALVGLVGDEGGEGFERDADGEGGIGEIDAGQGELAGEGGGGEADQAGRVLGAESAGAFVGRLDARFQHAGDGLAGAGLHPDGGEGVLGALPLSGRLKISQSRSCPRPPSEMAPAGDASQGEGDGGEVSSGEDAGVGDIGGRAGGGAAA
jgi:hypothetical protein